MVQKYFLILLILKVWNKADLMNASTFKVITPEDPTQKVDCVFVNFVLELTQFVMFMFWIKLNNIFIYTLNEGPIKPPIKSTLTISR